MSERCGRRRDEVSTRREEVLRQNAAMERVQEVAAAHGFDADAGAQQAVYEVLLDYAAQERQGLIGALAAEYADVVARRGTWRRDRIPEAEMERALCALGAERALHRVALRLGLAWDELRERAGQRATAAASPEEGAP